MVKWLVKSKSVRVVSVEWCACVCTYVIVCISICACLYTVACVVLWCGIDSAWNRPCTRYPERFRWGSEVKTNRWQNRLLWAVLDFLSLSLPLQLFIFLLYSVHQLVLILPNTQDTSDKRERLTLQTTYGTRHTTLGVCVWEWERDREEMEPRVWFYLRGQILVCKHIQTRMHTLMLTETVVA